MRPSGVALVEKSATTGSSSVGNAQHAMRGQSTRAAVEQVVDDDRGVRLRRSVRTKQVEQERPQRVDSKFGIGHWFARRSSRLSFASHSTIWLPQGSTNDAW